MSEQLGRLWALLADRYVVESELGRGGMALVFRARDLRHDRPVALKVVRPELASVVGRERFLREIQVAAKLQHPNIVPVHDSGGTEDTLYYVMPYVEGESLGARLRRDGQLPITQALEFTRDVASALSYAHERGIVHRDIKPENILLSGGRALVADFGIARAFGNVEARLTETGLVIGTPAYMSPEQAAGGRDVDARSDVYALGCVLYEMLTGETPYTGPSAQAIIAKRFIEPIPHVRTLREAVPPGLEHAVTRALAKMPVDRFQTAAELAAALTPEAIAAANAATRPTAPVVQASSAHGRRRRRVLAVVGGAIVASIAAAVALRRSPAPPPAGTAAITPDARRVVVAVFANKTGDPSLDPLGDITADYLARGLADTRLVEVIDARAEQAADPNARARGVAGARALARALGASSVIWGAYYRVGDSLQFQAQFTDAATGELIGAATPATGPVREQTQGVEILRQRVMTTLAARLDPEFSRFEDSSRPASYDAYREYLAGDALDLKPCPAERDCQAELIAHYWRAYALDSSFTLPLVAIAQASANMGQCARTDSIAEALRPRRDQLPVAERARLDVAAHLCGRRPLLAQEAARQGMAAVPRSDALVVSYAWLARHNGFLREAVAVTEELVRRRNDPTRGGGNLIIPYHLLGEHERELEVARAARSALPGNLEYLSFEARALVGLARLDDVTAVLAEMLRVPEDAPQQGPKALWLDEVGRDLRAHGHVKEARTVFERALRSYESLPRKAQADDNQRRALVLLLYDLGRWREAVPIARDFVAKYPDDVMARSRLGAVYARLGDRKSLGGVDRWLAEWNEPYRDFTISPTFERARLAAILGERDRAVALLRQAADEGAFLDSGQGFGPHSDPDFESLRDYPPFQELMKPKG